MHILETSKIAELIIEPVHPDFEAPSYASEGDSGLDVKALEDYTIKPGETKLFMLGFRMKIPRHHWHNIGYRYECQVRPRSGLSLKTGIRVANAPGTVDNFYTAEVGVILTNTGTSEYKVSKGDRIAQLVFNEVLRPLTITIGTVESRREGGFGSTGK